jgi:cytochrome P450
MTDYAMFTLAGDAAVQGIINSYKDAEVDHNGLYDLVLGDLERLQTIRAFAEATDTAVREAVYQECLRLRPQIVFRTRRNKTVDAA